MKLQRYKRDSQVSYALGATLVAELLKTHPYSITRVFLRPSNKYGADLESILKTLKENNIEIIESTKAFNILGAKDNCLLAAEFKKAALSQPRFRAHTTGNKELILYNPSDSGNLGTIMRSAVAFGYDTITIVPPAVDPYDPKVVRASMGAIFHLYIYIEEERRLYIDPDSTLDKFFAFVLDENAEPLETISPYEYTDWNLVLIFGNEAAGLPKDFCSRTGATPVYIKQSKNVDSLNLGVAASIAMHYFS